ncbi:SPOR domain-containing protein, partial [Thermodesulfobacteriota bacterium]
ADTRAEDIEQGVEGVLESFDAVPDADERRQEIPEVPVDIDVAAEEERDEADTQAEEIEQGVEGVFESFDAVPDADERRQEVPEVPVNVEVDEVVEEVEKVDIKRKKSRLPRFIYAAFGILAILIAATVFVVFKPSDAPFEDVPVEVTKPDEIQPPVKIDQITEIKPLKTVSRQTSEPVETKDAEPPEVVFEAKDQTPDKDRVIDLTEELNTFLEKWKTAWENAAGDQGDLDAYMSFYSDDFSSKGRDKSAWEEDKAPTNRKKEWIRLGLSDIQIDETGMDDKVKVRFIQDYQSSNYSGKSRKTLTLKKEDSGWKIVGTEETTGIKGFEAIEQKIQTGIATKRTHLYPYTIHIASYRDKEKSNKLVKTLRDEGILAFSTLVDIPGKGVWHRISVGYYETMKDARNDAFTLTDKKSLYANIVEKPYAILIGVFDSDNELQLVESKLWSMGYTPYRVPEEQHKGRNRLYIGAYSSKENAAGENQKLLDEKIATTVVKR